MTEFIYSILYNSPPEQKKGLGKAALKVVSTSTRARNFATNSTLDEKLKIMAEFGMSYSLVLHPKGQVTVNELKQMMQKYNEGRAAAGVEHAAKSNIFVTTDKETVHILGLSAATIHHETYMLNLDILKTGHALKKWKRNAKCAENEEIKEANENAILIDKTIIQGVLAAKYTDGFLGITEKELLVLQYLSINKHLFLSKERILDYFKGVLKAGWITTALKNLFAANYIRKHIEPRPLKFMITASGIDIVNKFRNRVLNAIN